MNIDPKIANTVEIYDKGVWHKCNDILGEAEEAVLVENEVMKVSSLPLGPVVNDSLKVTGSTDSKLGLYSAVINRIM